MCRALPWAGEKTEVKSDLLLALSFVWSRGNPLTGDSPPEKTRALSQETISVPLAFAWSTR